jgi:hypothetical protein
MDVGSFAHGIRTEALTATQPPKNPREPVQSVPRGRTREVALIFVV